MDVPVVLTVVLFVCGMIARLAHVKAGHVELSSSVGQLVIDEADLVFSYGYHDDLVALLAKLPKVEFRKLHLLGTAPAKLCMWSYFYEKIIIQHVISGVEEFFCYSGPMSQRLPNAMIRTCTKIIFHFKSSFLVQGPPDAADVSDAWRRGGRAEKTGAQAAGRYWRLPYQFGTMSSWTQFASWRAGSQVPLIRFPPQVVLKLEDSDLPDKNQLAQYVVRCHVKDKFMLT